MNADRIPTRVPPPRTPTTIAPWLRIALLAALALLSGCDKTSQKEDPVAQPIFAAVRAQITALNHRDAAGAVAMMHPEAPGLETTRKTTELVTSTFDLIYMIQSLTLESANEDEAKVRFTELTQKVSNPAVRRDDAVGPASSDASQTMRLVTPKKEEPQFRNNRVVGIHTLRKYQGVWKIYYTQVLKFEYLD